MREKFESKFWKIYDFKLVRSKTLSYDYIFVSLKLVYIQPDFMNFGLKDHPLAYWGVDWVHSRVSKCV